MYGCTFELSICEMLLPWGNIYLCLSNAICELCALRASGYQSKNIICEETCKLLEQRHNTLLAPSTWLNAKDGDFPLFLIHMIMLPRVASILPFFLCLDRKWSKTVYHRLLAIGHLTPMASQKDGYKIWWLRWLLLSSTASNICILLTEY